MDGRAHLSTVLAGVYMRKRSKFNFTHEAIWIPLPDDLISLTHRIPVILYDQIGNGASSHWPDAPKDFWVPSLFMDELDNLTQALGISDDFDLLGQSWGGKHRSRFSVSMLLTSLTCACCLFSQVCSLLSMQQLVHQKA
jgi:hypothetical protein